MGRPRRDRRTKAPIHRSTTASPNRGAPDFMRRDLLGMKQQIIPKIPNNYLYIGTAALGLIGTALVASDMGLVDLSFFGLGQSGLVGSASANPAVVKTGEPLKITGDIFGKNSQPVKIPSIYLAIWEDNGDQAYNQMVGQNSSHFEADIQTANFRDGTYSFAVDNKPIVGKPPELTNVPAYTPFDTSVSPGGAAFPGQPKEFGITLT